MAPLAYLPSDSGDAVYIFCVQGRGADQPDWYGNLVAAGTAVVERGTQSYPVTVVEVTGQETATRSSRRAGASGADLR